MVGQGSGIKLHREDKTCCRSRVMPNEKFEKIFVNVQTEKYAIAIVAN